MKMNTLAKCSIMMAGILTSFVYVNATTLHIDTKLKPNFEEITKTETTSSSLILQSKSHDCGIPASFASKIGSQSTASEDLNSDLKKLSSQILSGQIEAVVCEENRSASNPTTSYVAVGYAGPFKSQLSIANVNYGKISSVSIGDYGLTVSAKNHECLISADYASKQLSKAQLMDIAASIQSGKILKISCEKELSFVDSDNNIVIKTKN